MCAVTEPSDGGTTLVNNWTSTDPGAGLMTTDIGSVNGGGCIITLRGAKYPPTAQPTVYSTYLARTDDGSGLCQGPLEYRLLGSSSSTGLTLAAGGCGVVLSGIGTFPGATGTGPNFQATYLNFLAQAVQDATKATSAIQTN